MIGDLRSRTDQNAAVLELLNTPRQDSPAQKMFGKNKSSQL